MEERELLCSASRTCAVDAVDRTGIEAGGPQADLAGLDHRRPRLGRCICGSRQVVGSGPDEKRLRRMAATCPRRDVITIRSWQEDMDAVWAEIDFLMLPSRYEGMPLVMLEALARGIPVIGSACDGMAELLPPSWLFEPGNADELAVTFAGIRHIWQNEIAPLRNRVRTEMTIDAFRSAFRAAVLG